MLCYSMLANLIKNAVEAAPAGSRVAVTLSLCGDGLAVAIHNDGIVPPDIRDRFFEKYVTHGKTKGTGLGTYSAKLIARTHGGDIGLETSDDAGTTVTVRLPAESPEEAGLAEVA